ncbi:unnamed protein product [Dibothriocephalus latus]|uniref:EGF-like domain-containing protein n=1 Tax=Dibothriocephalus latus TaxID=60516 RepID=A0A3P6TR22_DIBLA|nr:unnamed protein product [Dibothriocephalus latus]
MLICLTVGLTCREVSGFMASRPEPARFELGGWAPQKKDNADDEADSGTSSTSEVSKRLSMHQKDMLRRIVYEVSHCMRPCLNNGITLLPRNTVDLCRCVCQPGNYGLACEYELTEEEKRLHRYAH